MFAVEELVLSHDAAELSCPPFTLPTSLCHSLNQRADGNRQRHTPTDMIRRPHEPLRWGQMMFRMYRITSPLVNRDGGGDYLTDLKNVVKKIYIKRRDVKFHTVGCESPLPENGLQQKNNSYTVMMEVFIGFAYLFIYLTIVPLKKCQIN